MTGQQRKSRQSPKSSQTYDGFVAGLSRSPTFWRNRQLPDEDDGWSLQLAVLRSQGTKRQRKPTVPRVDDDGARPVVDGVAGG